MVIKVGGAYHGWSDTMVYGLRVPGTFRMNAKGIPFGATSRTREIFPHDLGHAASASSIENRVRGGTAAVDRRAARPRVGHPPGARTTSTRGSASCATSSARC